MVKVNLLICNHCFHVSNRVHENALNFVDSGSGEIDSGTEQYLSYIEVIHLVSHITITINIESSSFTGN